MPTGHSGACSRVALGSNIGKWMPIMGVWIGWVTRPYLWIFLYPFVWWLYSLSNSSQSIWEGNSVSSAISVNWSGCLIHLAKGVLLLVLWGWWFPSVSSINVRLYKLWWQNSNWWWIESTFLAVQYNWFRPNREISKSHRHKSQTRVTQIEFGWLTLVAINVGN